MKKCKYCNGTGKAKDAPGKYGSVKIGGYSIGVEKPVNASCTKCRGTGKRMK